MKKTQVYQDQSGFVSIVVCLIIMVILSLVTIGFAQIMSREQRQALDRQLSTQAFYAAESGVNDARTSKFVGYGSTCGASASVLDSASLQSVHTTCVFVNKEPRVIKYNDVDLSPKVFPIHTVDSGGALVTPDTLVISWSKAPSTTNPAWPDFRPAAASGWPSTGANWGVNTGLGNVYIIPFNANDSRANINANTSHILLNPKNGAGTQTLAATRGAGSGTSVDGACVAATGTCKVTITGFVPSTELYMTISSLYTSSNFEISATRAGAPLNFRDVQAIVDSTGRTTDVVRRIEARVPLVPLNDYPSGALIGDVCKLWRGIPSPAVSTNDALCN